MGSTSNFGLKSGQRREPLVCFQPYDYKNSPIPTWKSTNDRRFLDRLKFPLHVEDHHNTIMPPLQRTIYTGTFIYTPTLGSLSISEHLAIGVDEGVIRHIKDLSPNGRQYDRRDVVNETERVRAAAVKWGWGETGWKWVVGGKEGRSWWFPGFVGKLYFARKIGIHAWLH